MGASLHDLRAILRLKENGLLPPRFAVAEIGAQQFGNQVLRDPDIMPAFAVAFGVAPQSFGTLPPPRSAAPGIEPLDQKAPFTKELWDWLGCPYLAIDFDQAPHVLRLDLNFDDVPDAHRGRYDLVTNLGTTEHVANQAQAMKVIHDLTRHRGLMLHVVPFQGNYDHSMFLYTPKFFWTLSRSCRYHIHEMTFTVDAQAVPFKPNFIDFASRHDPSQRALLESHREDDCHLVVVMEKREDIPFATPLEIHGGGLDPDMARRYRV